MSEEKDFKRLTAFRTSLKNIINADYFKEEEGTDFIEVGKLKVSRVRIIATVVYKKVNEEGSYAFLVIDDSSETISVKAWKDEVKRLEKPVIGDIIEMIGRVREWEGQRYLTCELIKVLKDPNHWLYHEYELLLTREKVERIEEKKEKGISTGVEAKKEVKENSEELIVRIIKENDMGKGTSLALVAKISKLSQKQVEEVLKNLLMDGLIYEPLKHNYKILEL